MQKTPNILLIVCDQLRYDCVGSSGMRPVRTPHMDRIARRGVRFENAYTPLPTCCPARQCLISARRPERDGFLWNYDLTLGVPSLAPHPGLWPARLFASGYASAYVGKWHVSDAYSPLHFGFDTYDGDEGYKAFRRADIGQTAFTSEFEGEVDPAPPEATHTRWLADTAARRLAALAAGGRPWHMRVDFSEPHLPCRPCAQFAGLYRPEDIPPWPSFAEDFAGKPYIQKQMLHSWGIADYDWARWAPIVARYHAVITQTDDAIGRVLAALGASGAEEDTLVVLTADHGDTCGGHRMIDKHYILYDDVVRVPLLAMWPGRLPEGAVRREFVHNMLDLGPTFLEAAGLPAQEGADGCSLLPVMLGRTPDGWRDCAVSTYNGQQFGLYTQRMLRTNEWKYIWNTTDVDELYDLVADPAELRNRACDPACKEILADLRRRLCQILMDEGDGLVCNRSHWLREQLLGRTAKL